MQIKNKDMKWFVDFVLESIEQDCPQSAAIGTLILVREIRRERKAARAAMAVALEDFIIWPITHVERVDLLRCPVSQYGMETKLAITCGPEFA